MKKKDSIPELPIKTILELRELQIEDLTLKNTLYEMNIKFQDLSQRSMNATQKLNSAYLAVQRMGNHVLDRKTLKYSLEKEENSNAVKNNLHN